MKKRETFTTLQKVSNHIESNLNGASEKKKVVLMYSFNGTGKTRLSTMIGNQLEEEDSEKLELLSYNAFFEDLFSWDNDEYILKFNPRHYIIKFMIDQGLENEITDNFQKLTRSKILPNFDLENGQITFTFASGDNRSETNIKISKGEESLFIWSIFYTVLEQIILILSSEEENRETDIFNDLKYIVIDDPVSSIDDTKIITMAVALIQTLNSVDDSINFLITTHHPMFFNVLHSSLNGGGFKCKLHTYLLSKNPTEYILQEQKDTPFAYHLVVKDEIQEAIQSNTLKRYHFNLFRGLLEKTSTFLGYNKWSDCLDDTNKQEIDRLVNLYSHGRLSDLESENFPDEHKESFKEAFKVFNEKFKQSHMTKEQAIELIQEKIDEMKFSEIESETDRMSLDHWAEATERILIRIFGEKSREYKDFCSNLYDPMRSKSGRRIYFTDGIIRVKKLLPQFIKDIERFGIGQPKTPKKSRDKSKTPGIAIYNSNHNQQNQEMNVNFILGSILDELEDAQKLELKSQLESYKKGDLSFRGFVKFLGSLGKGVAENILAGIITNPTLIEQLLTRLS